MRSKRKTFLLVIFLLSSVCLASAKTYLVSVGISDYPGTVNDVGGPVEDANIIAWIYTKNTNVEYKILLNNQATVNNIVNTMTTVFSQAQENDIVVFFYSGHGSPGCFNAYDGDLTYSMIRQAMSKSYSKNKMIFANACYSGKISTSKKESKNQETEAKKANVMLFLSSRSNESSLGYADMENSIFATFLQKGLRGGADANKDRIITAKELYNYVHTNIIKATKDKQHPVMWGNFSDNMVVMKW